MADSQQELQVAWLKREIVQADTISALMLTSVSDVSCVHRFILVNSTLLIDARL